jgi:hypothetical protein
LESVSRWRLLPGEQIASGLDPPETPLRRLRRVVIRTIADRVRGGIGLRVLRLPLIRRGFVLVETIECLRFAVNQRLKTKKVRSVTAYVVWWRGGFPGWSGRIGPLPGLRRQQVYSPKRGKGPARIRVTLDEPQPMSEVLTAILYGLRPAQPLPKLSSSDADALRGVRSPITVAPQRPLILVDAERVNPRGRRFDAYRSDASRFVLTFAGPGERLPRVLPGTPRWRTGDVPLLGWPAIGALRNVGVVECREIPDTDPVGAASLLVQLAMTGVVLRATRLPAAVSALMAPELVEMLREPLPPLTTTDSAGAIGSSLGLELRSVRQRRLAMRRHSTRFALAGQANGVAAPPSVSAVLATLRPDFLTTALRAIADQTYPNLEIVLCLHGIDLGDEHRRLLAECGRPYQVVRVPASEPFGSALGIATARASGSLITKFDDDDTYGPEHIWDLVLARHYSGATLVGKGAEFVFLEDANVTVRRWSGRPEWSDTFVAGGTMLMGTGDLQRFGGWRPVARSVDRAMFDRVNRAGGTVYRTHPLGYLYHRRPKGHTWDPGTEYFLKNPRQRWDGILRSTEFGTSTVESGLPPVQYPEQPPQDADVAGLAVERGQRDEGTHPPYGQGLRPGELAQPVVAVNATEAGVTDAAEG